ncbi:MAG: hypothetical protein CSA66_03055 [Proteobacteria bacterium]|nr:MAG: hypothetical protein CSA66_03055 [Pseudomonadota bacterium]
MTEWWYLHAHIETVDRRRFAVFASFFRMVKGEDEATRAPQYAHSMTWALTDLDGGKYYPDSLVDRDAPRLGLDKLQRGEGTRDPRLRRALEEVLERGNVPFPDHMFEQEPFVHDRKLELDFDGNRLWKRDDGAYVLELFHQYFKHGVELVFTPGKPAIRHGEDGVVRGHDGADMFYYFIPRCEVTGRVTFDGIPRPVERASGWYDHEFGGQRLGQRALVIDPDGTRHAYDELELEPLNEWVSTRTFNRYPSRWRLEVPGADLSLAVDGVFDDQEFVTLISKPAFWEGRCAASGTRAGVEVTGRAYIERSGFLTANSLDDFFREVGKAVRGSVANLLPFEPTYEQVRDLVASEERDHYMDGVDLAQFVKTGVVPVREITDRGGKGWRSYAALACCDVVGGDSRDFVHWLAMPELMHVGSLIVDDVQDGSTVRRGGPTCHTVHGDAIAINAGTSCYFMGQHMLQGTQVSDADKLRLYNLYFEALRAGHAGQAADIRGLDEYMPKAVESGQSDEIEGRLLAVHRLKTAAPAGSLARMGAIVGAGTEAQVEGLGRYFESVGLAFQIVDDVLNLRGFERGLKQCGEDIAHGKVTLPTVKAMSRLPHDDRVWIWETIRSKPQDQAVIDAVIAKLEGCGAIDACAQQAEELIESAWARLQPLVEDSIVKIMLRSFGWYVLQRHY